MGFGNGDGGGSFGHRGPPTSFGDKGGPPPPFGEGPFYCNLLIRFKITVTYYADLIASSANPAGRWTWIKLNLTVRKRCQEAKAEEGATITVKIDNVGERGSGRSESGIPKKDICKTFDGIEGTETIEPEAISDLMKDISNATNEMGADFSLGDFMSSLCNNRDKGSGFYSVELTCKKNLGTCKEIADNPYPVGDDGTTDEDCEKDFKIMIVMPGIISNIPFGGRPDWTSGLIGGHTAKIDPCSFSDLLKCWKENPDADTSLSDDAAGDITSAIPWGVIFGDDPSQDLVNTITDIALTDAQEKCKKKK